MPAPAMPGLRLLSLALLHYLIRSRILLFFISDSMLSWECSPFKKNVTGDLPTYVVPVDSPAPTNLTDLLSILIMHKSYVLAFFPFRWIL